MHNVQLFVKLRRQLLLRCGTFTAVGVLLVVFLVFVMQVFLLEPRGSEEPRVGTQQERSDGKQQTFAPIDIVDSPEALSKDLLQHPSGLFQLKSSVLLVWSYRDEPLDGNTPSHIRQSITALRSIHKRRSYNFVHVLANASNAAKLLALNTGSSFVPHKAFPEKLSARNREAYFAGAVLHKFGGVYMGLRSIPMLPFLHFLVEPRWRRGREFCLMSLEAEDELGIVGPVFHAASNLTATWVQLVHSMLDDFLLDSGGDDEEAEPHVISLTEFAVVRNSMQDSLIPILCDEQMLNTQKRYAVNMQPYSEEMEGESE